MEYDLQEHLRLDLRELVQRRELRRLLNLIDHLPRNSRYAEAVAADEEHAQMMIRAGILDQPKEPYKPPMSSWSPEVAIIADLIDAVNALRATTVAVNSKSGKPPEIKAYPRPGTMLDKVRREERRRRHEDLVARVNAAREREGMA